MCWTTQTALLAWCRLANRRQPHFLPEAAVETLHVPLPNDNDDAVTGSIIEPISLRVSFHDPSATSGITEPLLAACTGQTVRLHMALCELSNLQASKSALRNACLIFEPIHSVPAAKLASASGPMNVLTVGRYDVQIAQ